MDTDSANRAGWLRRSLRVLGQRRSVVVVGVLSTALPALVLSLLHDDTYEAEAQVLVRTDDPGVQVALLEGDRVYDDVVARTTGGDIPAVHGRYLADSELLIVSVRATTARTAALFASAYADAYLLIAPRVAGETGAEPPVVQLVRAAVEPEQRAAPTPLRTTGFAALVGLLLGLGAAIALHRRDDAVRSAADLERLDPRFAVLAVIPVDPGAATRPLPLQRGADPAAAAYRHLRDTLAELRPAPDHQPMRVVQITGVRSGDGASTTAANLALVSAERTDHVVLLDTDLRHPVVHRLFTVDGSLGLVDNLADELIDMTLLPLHDRLSVLAAGTTTASPVALLSRRRMDEVVADIAARTTHLIVDSPAVDTGDATAASRLVDGVVVVVGQGTSQRQVRAAVQQLVDAGAPMVGFVLNRFVA